MPALEIPAHLQRVMLEMQVEAMERRRAAVLADPVKHKTTLEFPEGARLNSLYYGKIKSRGRETSYHYSTERNLAGYFLGWRETWAPNKGEGKRDQWIASKRRKTVAEKMLARHKAHQRRLGK